jgi:hypothetical protein
MRKRIIIDLEDKPALALIEILLTSRWDFRVQNINGDGKATVRAVVAAPSKPTRVEPPPMLAPPAPAFNPELLKPPEFLPEVTVEVPAETLMEVALDSALERAKDDGVVYPEYPEPKYATHRQFTVDQIAESSTGELTRHDIVKAWQRDDRPIGSLPKTLSELTELRRIVRVSDTPPTYRLGPNAEPSEESGPTPDRPTPIPVLTPAPAVPSEKVTMADRIMMGRVVGELIQVQDLNPFAAELVQSMSSISVAVTKLCRNGYLESIGPFRSGQYRVLKVPGNQPLSFSRAAKVPPKPPSSPAPFRFKGEEAAEAITTKAESFHGAPFDKLEVTEGLLHQGFGRSTLLKQVRNFVHIGRFEELPGGKLRLLPPRPSLLADGLPPLQVNEVPVEQPPPDPEPTDDIRQLILDDMSIYAGKDFKSSDIRSLAEKHNIKEGPLYATFHKMILAKEVIDQGGGYYAIPQ